MLNYQAPSKQSWIWLKTKNYFVSHFIYNTETIVLGEMPSGENDRLYFFLTRDLGFVMAQAVGVRLLKSKLRFHLSLFARVDVELVRGKNIWRAVNVYPKENERFHLTPRAALFARLALLIRRLVHGEEENIRLFNEVSGAREIIAQNNLSDKEADSLELAAAARILHSLGYLNAEEYGLVFDGALTKTTLARVPPLRSSLLAGINQALKESQL